MLGTFENLQPRIDIQVTGTNPAPATIKAIIDSGFNGYLKIPYSVAFPLGLALIGIQPHTIADGSSKDHFVCTGKVCIDGTCVETSIDIHPADIILIGTQLLRELKKTFTLNCELGKVEITSN